MYLLKAKHVLILAAVAFCISVQFQPAPAQSQSWCFLFSCLQPVPGGPLVQAAQRSVSVWRSTHWSAALGMAPAPASLDTTAKSVRKVPHTASFPTSASPCVPETSPSSVYLLCMAAATHIHILLMIWGGVNPARVAGASREIDNWRNFSLVKWQHKTRTQILIQPWIMKVVWVFISVLFWHSQ